MADNRFNPFDHGALRKQHEGRWQLETDVAEMTLDVLEAGTYLPKFSAKEHEDEYAYRKRMSVPLDICRDAVRIRIDNLWRTPPKREVDENSPYAELIQRLIDDCDGDGTTLDAFVKRALWNYYVTGVDIVTQSMQAPPGVEIVSRQDEQEFGIRPYFMQFTPLERNDWGVNGSRNFTWARYCLGEEQPADETGGGNAEVTLFLTLTGDIWRIHRATRPKASGVVIVETQEGPHRLGRPPIIKFYFSESQKTGQGGVPLSLLTRPAIVAKVALNIKSQADADLLAAVPRWYATGLNAEDVPDTYGPGVLLKLANPASQIGVVQGGADHIREKREWLLLYLGEILRLLKFRGGMAELEANSGSGLKLAMERTDLDNELRSTAAQVEQLELEMMRQAVCLSGDVQISPQAAAEELGYQVTYNRDFVLEPVGEMLDNLVKWVRDCSYLAEDMSEITREMTRQLVNMLVREGTPASEAALSQIDEASVKKPRAPVPVIEPQSDEANEEAPGTGQSASD